MTASTSKRIFKLLCNSSSASYYCEESQCLNDCYFYFGVPVAQRIFLEVSQKFVLVARFRLFSVDADWQGCERVCGKAVISCYFSGSSVCMSFIACHFTYSWCFVRATVYSMVLLLFIFFFVTLRVQVQPHNILLLAHSGLLCVPKHFRCAT